MKKINCPNVAKNLFILLIVSLVFAIYFQSNVYALTSDNINFQGKIVRNDTGYEGLNVVPGSPACVVDGAGNDTCDFQVAYYTASTGGTLLLTELFTNIEIGQYDGVFELSLGSGSMTTTSQCRDGTCNTPVEVISEYKDLYLELKFSPDGTNLTETFTRMPLEASPYAILSKYAEGAKDAFKLSTSLGYEGTNTPTTGMVYYNTTTSQLTVYNGTSWEGVKSSLWTDAGTFTYLTSTTDDLILGASTVSDSTFFFDMDGGSGSYLEIDDASNTNRLLTILSGGNVGIGTATPGAKLEVAGSSSTITNASGNLTISTGGLNGDILLSPHGTGRVLVSTKLGIKDTGTTPTHYTFFQGGDQSADITYTLPNADGTASGQVLTTNASGVLSWQTVATGSTAWDDILDPDSNSVIVHGAYSTDMQFDTFTSGSAFKVSSAATGLTGSLLDVSLTGSNAANTGSLFALNNTGTLNTGTSFLINHFATGTGNLAFRVNDESGDTTPFVIDGGGNVGIGTTTPRGALDVMGDEYIGSTATTNKLVIQTSSLGQYLLTFQKSGDPVTGFTMGAGGSLSLSGGPRQLGVGTLVADTAIRMNGDGYFITGTGVGGSHSLIFKNDANVEVARFLHSGNFGLGVAAPTGVLHLKAGTAAANTAPLKFTAGTNLGTAESGAMEWDGSRLYMTNNDATPLRNTIAYTSDLTGLITGLRWDEIASPQDNTSMAHGQYITSFSFDSVTSATAFGLSSSSLTTGNVLGISTTSTALTTGGLLNISATGAPAAAWSGALAKIEYNNADADVDGSALQLGLLGTTALGSGTVLNITTSQTGTGALALRVNDDGTYTDSTPFVIDSAGSVGVGIAAPTGKLDVVDGSYGIGLNVQQSARDYLRYQGRNLTLSAFNSHNNGFDFTMDSTGTDFRISLGSYSTYGLGTRMISSGDMIFKVGNLTEASAVTAMTIKTTGEVGIGEVSPSAYLHLKAGTATVGTAPLKFTAGTNLTTAESGAMEWDGSRLYMTNTTPTRNTLAYLSDLSSFLTQGYQTIQEEATSLTQRSILNFVGSGFTATDDGANTRTNITLNSKLNAYADLVSANGVLTNTSGTLSWTNLSASLLPTGTEGQMLYNNAGTWTAHSGMYWNDVNSRLGVGTTSPAQSVDIRKGTLVSSSPVTGTVSSAFSVNGVNYGSQFFTSDTYGRAAGVFVSGLGPSSLPYVIPTLGGWGKVGLVVSSNHLGGTTQAVGMFSYTTQSNAATVGVNHGISIYSLAKPESLSSISGGNWIGVQGTGDISAPTTLYNSPVAYGGLFSGIAKAGGTAYGIYTTATGGDTNYGIYSAAGMNYLASNVGIGTTTPASLLTVGSGDLFQVNTTGDLIKIKNVTYSWPSSNGSGVLTNNGSGTLTWAAASGATAWDDIGDPDASSSIAHGAFLSEFTFNSIATDSAFNLSSTSVLGAASSSSTMLEIARSGANTNTAHTAYGVYSTVTNTNATSGTNIAGYFSASGATTANYGLLVANGNVGIGTTTPSNKFVVNTSAYSTIELQYGGTSVVDIFSNVSSNIFIGLDSGSVISTGTGNIALGDNALSANTTGLSNTAIGHFALDTNVAKQGSTALGYQAMMYANSTATAGLSYNTAIGYQALTGSGVAANNTGTQNTAVGHQSMTANTSGSSNTALGVNTLNANTTGTENVAIGQNALFTNVAKQGSVAIGYEAMRYANSTAIETQSNNTAIGYQALMGSSTPANNTGTGNSVLGFQAGRNNTTGGNNVAIGTFAMSETTTGSVNVVIGDMALGYNSVGEHTGTVAVGAGVMSETTVSTTGNTGVGTGSLYSVGGSYNTALGYAAGGALLTGSYNIIIGQYVEAPSATGSYQLNIGNSIYGNLSNDYISIGDSTPTEGMFTVGATSQFRIDTNGDLTRIKDVPYTWPSSNASGILANNGSGTLSWSTIASLGGVTGTGSGTATAGQITWWNGTSTITGENDFYWDASNNRLGIGTSTPTASIDIAGASSTISNASGNITITPASNLIVSQGYVGIGTASPTSTLDLYHATVGPVLTLRSGIADYSGVIMFKDQTNSTNARINANLADSYYSNSLSFQSTSGLNFVSNSISSDQYPAMIITYAGSVGIGDTSPASLLTVGSGDLFQVRSTGELGIGVAPSTSYSIYTTGRSYGINAQGSSMGGRFYDTSGTSTTYVAYGNYGLYTAQNGYFGGNVGIRTTSANNPLSVVSPSSSVSAIQFGLTATAGGYLMSSFDHQFNISGGARYTTGAYWEARSTTASIIGSYNGELMFYNNTGLTVGSTFTPTERMRIDSSGNVGIGTTSPAGLLHLYGTTDDVLIIHARDTGQGRIFFREGGGATYGGLVGYDSVNDRLELSTLNNSVEMPGIYIARTTGYVTHPSGHADLAENYQSVGTVLRGSLVSINTTTPWTVTAANMEKKSLVGVVTTNPGAVMDADGGFQIGYTTKLVYKNEKTPIALVGTAPTLVTHINGSIDIGDSIGVSELNGFGAKMTTAGYTVGKALEKIDTNSCISVSSLESITWPEDDGKNTLKPCYILSNGTIVGKIMVAIQPSWYDPGSTATTENITVPGWYRIASLSSNTDDYGRFKINNTSVGSSQNLLISVDSVDTKENINVISNFMSGDYNITKTRINSENGTKYLEIYLPNVNGNQIKVSIDGENGEWVSTSITQVIEETLTIKEYSLSGLLFGVSDMLQVEDTGLKVGGDLIASTTTANIGDTTSRWNDIYAKGAIRLGSGNGQEGAIRFNTESKRLELSNDGSTWVQLGDLTSQMVISAEYPGAILFADGSDNLGKMTSDAIEENSTFKNYYEWISNKEVAQDYDILVRITLPNDFVSWKDDAIYLDYMTQNSVSVENNSVDVTLIGNSGVDAQSVDHISTLPGAWERMSLKSLDINDCNAPGDSCTLRISLTSSMEYFTRVGDITLNYNRSL